MPLIEQMANIGGEVSRALNWRGKGRPEYAGQAFDRALELIDMTLATRLNYARLRELARMREGLVDFFIGSNTFLSTEASWRNYFSAFAFAARRNR
jgi:hypothetical protein